MTSRPAWSFTLLLVAVMCAAQAFTSDAQPEKGPTPLLKQLNAIAQEQLERRADTIARIRDVPGAARRQAAVTGMVITR